MVVAAATVYGDSVVRVGLPWHHSSRSPASTAIADFANVRSGVVRQGRLRIYPDGKNVLRKGFAEVFKIEFSEDCSP